MSYAILGRGLCYLDQVWGNTTKKPVWYSIDIVRSVSLEYIYNFLVITPIWTFLLLNKCRVCRRKRKTCTPEYETKIRPISTANMTCALVLLFKYCNTCNRILFISESDLKIDIKAWLTSLTESDYILKSTVI